MGPRASVLLPVFNGEKYLAQAISSVLNQTFKDFELLLLNDGSTDRTMEILTLYARLDARCQIHNWSNQGLIDTLNKGLAFAKGNIIFRMDHDDICRPTRFEKQVAYLDQHQECVALGSRILLIDADGLPICELFDEVEHDNIEDLYLSGSAGIAHPSAAMRRDALSRVGGYNRSFPNAEDVDLFLRLGEIGKLSNISEVLLEYRQHRESVCYVRRAEQYTHAIQAAQLACTRRGITRGNFVALDPPETEAASHRKWAWWALANGNVATARIHALRAFAKAPFDIENLRVIACAIRGR